MNDYNIRTIKTSNKYIIYNKSLVENIGLETFDASNFALNPIAVSVGGRNSAWFIKVNNINAVLRHYRRGGMIGKIIKNNYVWVGLEKTRSFHEFNILNKIYNLGLCVPQPIAAITQRTGLTYRAAIIVTTIENSKTLAEIILQDENVNETISSSVAKSILKLHDSGFWHADLNAYNILIDDENRAWIIDFDKALNIELTAAQRKNNLLRLQRSILKISNNKAKMWCNYIINNYSVLLANKNNPID